MVRLLILDEEARSLLFEVTAIPGITIIPSPLMLVQASWATKAGDVMKLAVPRSCPVRRLCRFIS